MTELTLSCIIIDDDPFARDILDDFLREHGGIQILKKTGDSKLAIKYIANLMPDIIFLDINMPHKTGMEILEEINDLHINTHVVFITAHENYIVEALRKKATDYILKPISQNELNEAIHRIKQLKFKKLPPPELSKKQDNKKIMFRNAHHSIILEPEYIIYIQAEGCYSKIYTKKGVEVITKNIGKIEEELEHAVFFRISRSSIINVAYLAKIDRLKRLVYLSFGNNQNVKLKASKERLYDLEARVTDLNQG
ncbi:MAG: LytR/AlgR family response regulator transcription factor [Bacteroidota bacterium]